MFTHPMKIAIDKLQLSKRRLKSACLRALKEVHRGYTQDVGAWIDFFVPADTHMLEQQLKNSSLRNFVYEDGNSVGMVMYLSSLMPYSEFVEQMNPPIKWTKFSSIYHFWTEILNYINDQVIPNRLQQAQANEGLI